MTEILFYHLENQPLERVLPVLLGKCLERGWRAVVQSGAVDRLETLDSVLWTYSDESFLAHGVADGKLDAEQPVLLTGEAENPNGAAVRFLVHGATIDDSSAYERVIHMFDGHDEQAVAGARENWKAANAAGHDVTYWQQDESGRWNKKA